MSDPAAIVRDPARVDRVVHLTRLALRTSGAGMALVDDRYTYQLSQEGLPPSLATQPRFDIHTTLTGALVASGSVVRLDDTLVAPQDRASTVLRAHGLRAYLGAAVRDPSGRVIGGLFVVHDEARRFSEDDIEIMSGMAELVGHEIFSPETPHEAPRAAPVRESEPHDLLVVDDNADGRALVQAFLEDTPHRSELVDSGQAALDRLSARAYDLVLLDLQMPDMNGIEVVRRVRAGEAEHGDRRTPVIAVTAHGSGSIIAAARRAGCDGHLEKPFGRDDLLRAIATHARRDAADQRRSSPLADRELHPAVAALVPAFLEARLRELRTLEAALARHDHESILRTAHNVKGLGGSYGFRDLSERSAALEDAARAHDDTAMRAHLVALGECVRELVARYVPTLTP